MYKYGYQERPHIASGWGWGAELVAALPPPYMMIAYMWVGGGRPPPYMMIHVGGGVGTPPPT